MDSKQYFLGQDQDAHWYLVPQEMRPQWDALKDYQDNDEVDAFIAAFGNMRINRHPSWVVFTQPEII